MVEAWRHYLEVWLAPFLIALNNKARVSMCPVYDLCPATQESITFSTFAEAN